MIYIIWFAASLCYLGLVNSMSAIVTSRHQGHGEEPACTIQGEEPHSCHVEVIDCFIPHEKKHSPYVVRKWHQTSSDYSHEEIVLWNDIITTDPKKIKNIIFNVTSNLNSECLIILVNEMFQSSSEKHAFRFKFIVTNNFVNSVMISGDKQQDYMHRRELRAEESEEDSNVTVAYSTPYLRISVSGPFVKKGKSIKLCPQVCRRPTWCVPLAGNKTDVYYPTKNLNSLFFVKVLPVGCQEQNDGGEKVDSDTFAFSRQDNFTVGKCVRHSDCSSWINNCSLDAIHLPAMKKIRVNLLAPNRCLHPINGFNIFLVKNPNMSECTDEPYKEGEMVQDDISKDEQPIFKVEFDQLPYANYCVKVRSVYPSCKIPASIYSGTIRLTEPESELPTNILPTEQPEDERSIWVIPCAAVAGVIGVLVIGVVFRITYKLRTNKIMKIHPTGPPAPRYNWPNRLDLLEHKPELRPSVLLLHCFDLTLVNALKEFLETCCLIKVDLIADVVVVEKYLTEGPATFSHNITYQYKKMMLYVNEKAVQVLRSVLDTNNELQSTSTPFMDEENLFRSCITRIADARSTSQYNMHRRLHAISVTSIPNTRFGEWLGLNCEYNDLPESLPYLFLALHDISENSHDAWKDALISFWEKQEAYRAFRAVVHQLRTSHQNAGSNFTHSSVPTNVETTV